MSDFANDSEKPSYPSNDQDPQEDGAANSSPVSGMKASEVAFYHYLPSADELAEYEEKVPGSSKHFFERARAQMDRHYELAREQLQLNKGNKESDLEVSAEDGSRRLELKTTAQITACIVLLIFVAGFFCCAAFGPWWSALCLLAILVAFLFYIFVDPEKADSKRKS